MAVFLARVGVGVSRFDQRRAQSRPDQVRQSQSDQHRHQGVDQIEDHHQGAQAAFDLVGDDRTQDRQDDQRSRQGGQRAKDQLRQELEVGRAVPPEHPDGNRHHDRDDDPDIERKPPGRLSGSSVDSGRREQAHQVGMRLILGRGHRGSGRNSRCQRLAGLFIGGMSNYGGSPASCECLAARLRWRIRPATPRAQGIGSD